MASARAAPLTVGQWIEFDRHRFPLVVADRASNAACSTLAAHPLVPSTSSHAPATQPGREYHTDAVVAPDMTIETSGPESADVPSSPATPTTQIDFYWRPGCGFCSMLQRKLDKFGVERVEHNIWDDPADAEIVRLHANGNETVPTVVVGDTGFVNPSAGQLLAFLAEHHPDLLPDGIEIPRPTAVSRLADRVFR